MDLDGGRTHVLTEAAKTLEYAALVMSATLDGYGERIVQKRRAIAVVIGHGDRAGSKGDGDEDVREVLEALRGGVERWRKMHEGTGSTVA